MGIEKLGLGQLVPAIFIKRENRFRAEIMIDGTLHKAHVPNSGRMRELLIPGSAVWVKPSKAPARKTAYSLALCRQGEQYICLNAHMANEIMEEWLSRKILPELSQAQEICREKKWGNSRFDFQLQKDGQTWFIEVKSVNLVRGETACFPDAPTERGRKHLLELSACRQAGFRSAVVFLVMGNQAKYFAPNQATDPLFAQTLEAVRVQGVEIYVYRCLIDLEHVAYGGRIAYE